MRICSVFNLAAQTILWIRYSTCRILNECKMFSPRSIIVSDNSTMTSNDHWDIWSCCVPLRLLKLNGRWKTGARTYCPPQVCTSSFDFLAIWNITGLKKRICGCLQPNKFISGIPDLDRVYVKTNLSRSETARVKTLRSTINVIPAKNSIWRQRTNHRSIAATPEEKQNHTLHLQERQCNPYEVQSGCVRAYSHGQSAGCGCAYVDVWKMGVITAPVTGSGTVHHVLPMYQTCMPLGLLPSTCNVIHGSIRVMISCGAVRPLYTKATSDRRKVHWGPWSRYGRVPHKVEINPIFNRLVHTP